VLLGTSGAELRPWANNFSFKPMAKNALLPDGSMSKRHIIQTLEYRWRVRAEIDCTGARGISTWQLVPTKPDRRVHA
jgi:hypothetical protein